jgi:GNAT superfamily N-acetyltransferase
MPGHPDLTSYQVLNTETADLDLVFRFFDESIRYQEARGYPAWRNYDKNAIIKDIEDKLQYKVVVSGEIGIVFSIRYSDPVIWRHLDKGDAIYLHRIVVNPAFKGQKLFGKILEWSLARCLEKGLTSLRMDTWADNPMIIEYYKSFGFRFIENYTTPDSAELPAHNRKLALTLLEYDNIRGTGR